MAKKKSKKKARKDIIYSTTKKGVTEISLSFDKNGNIVFDTEMINIYCQTSYDRSKGVKVLSRVPLEDRTQFEIENAINNNFDIVFAIDTNTRNIKGCNVSISGAIQCQKVISIDPAGVACNCWECFTPFCLEFIEAKSKPENLGWMMLIQYLPCFLKDTIRKRIGLIVDSDLDTLSHYNLRTNPIFEEFLLPENIKLIYASSDVGRDLFPNKMLKSADKASNICLDKLESGEIPFNNEKIKGAPYLAFRRLIPKKGVMAQYK